MSIFTATRRVAFPHCSHQYHTGTLTQGHLSSQTRSFGEGKQKDSEGSMHFCSKSESLA